MAVITCRCGLHQEGIESLKRAEVLADIHETRNMRYANRHDVRVFESDMDRMIAKLTERPAERKSRISNLVIDPACAAVIQKALGMEVSR